MEFNVENVKVVHWRDLCVSRQSSEMLSRSMYIGDIIEVCVEDMRCLCMSDWDRWLRFEVVNEARCWPTWLLKMSVSTNVSAWVVNCVICSVEELICRQQSGNRDACDMVSVYWRQDCRCGIADGGIDVVREWDVMLSNRCLRTMRPKLVRVPEEAWGRRSLCTFEGEVCEGWRWIDEVGRIRIFQFPKL